MDLAGLLAFHGVFLVICPPPRSATGLSPWPFALGEIMVRGGERVGIPGLMRPTASRAVIDRMAEAVLAASSLAKADLPPPAPVSRLSEVVILSDCLVPPPDFAEELRIFAQSQCHGHVMQILDPIEETFPFRGRVEFVESRGRVSLSRPGGPKAGVMIICACLPPIAPDCGRKPRSLGWSFAVHHTDQPPTRALLALHQRMGPGGHVSVKQEAGS